MNIAGKGFKKTASEVGKGMKKATVEVARGALKIAKGGKKMVEKTFGNFGGGKKFYFYLSKFIVYISKIYFDNKY